MDSYKNIKLINKIKCSKHVKLVKQNKTNKGSDLSNPNYLSVTLAFGQRKAVLFFLP